VRLDPSVIPSEAEESLIVAMMQERFLEAFGMTEGSAE
jgi:hypothetical protein